MVGTLWVAEIIAQHDSWRIDEHTNSHFFPHFFESFLSLLYPSQGIVEIKRTNETHTQSTGIPPVLTTMTPRRITRISPPVATLLATDPLARHEIIRLLGKYLFHPLLYQLLYLPAADVELITRRRWRRGRELDASGSNKSHGKCSFSVAGRRIILVKSAIYLIHCHAGRSG